jgi:pro-kumamolisin-like protein
LTGRSLIRAAVLAGTCALATAVAAPSLAAGDRSAIPQPPGAVPLAGTAAPATAHAQRLGDVPATRPVQAVVVLKPRNPNLLRALALRSSARPGLSEADIRRLFAPTPARVAATRRYLTSLGLHITAHTDMTLTVAGTASAAERAFGVGIGLYRSAAGTSFQAVSGSVTLPRAIAAWVQSVGGLGDPVRLRPATRIHRLHGSALITPSCTGATRAQHAFGGYLPADLGQSQAYGLNSLVGAGNDGTGQTIGMVEFSDYAHSDVTHFRSCFPGISGTYAPDVVVGGPNTDTSGRGEVALDLEVAMAAAPDAQVRAYIAPNDPDFAPAVIDRMRQDGVTIISDSWGACEPLLAPRLLAAENTSLELAAVAGISTFVASGDFGSTDCFPFTTDLAVDDPSSQPFATAVGGTGLEVPPVYGRRRETAWQSGGGGISMNWRKPLYQRGKTIAIRGRKCKSGRAECRETPDVALDARPKRTGYIIYCDRCGAGRGIVWAPVGGTSAAAPLMAAMTADADEAAGKRLGFANPFLYAQAGTAMFRDIVSGTNNIFGGRKYAAHPGYDLATGLGSVQAGAFATALAAYNPGAVSVGVTSIHLGGPVAGGRVAYGHKVAFHGTLTDTTSSQPVANAAILVITPFDTFRARTNAAGQWRVTRSLALTRNIRWHAAYLGSDTEAPAVTTARRLFVTPHLGLRMLLPFRNGHYVAAAGRPFTVMGRSRPLMAGAEIVLQSRRRGAWHGVTTAHVGGGGFYQATLRVARGASESLRWSFTGGTSRRWLSSVSRVATVLGR